MTKLKGKVKSIPVKEVTEGMQVLDIVNNSVEKVIGKGNNDPDHFIKITGLRGYSIISNLKTLVVDYTDGSTHSLIKKIGNKTYQDKLPQLIFKQLPLKYSQWQSAIDNGEVDSDKEIEFEIKVGYRNLGKHNGERFNEAEIQIAKIIPQKEKMYTREEVFNILVELAKDCEQDDSLLWYEELKEGKQYKDLERWFQTNVK